jgi:hypothetical protein
VIASVREWAKMWRKASGSAQANCVEVRTEAGGVKVRDSKDPQGPMLHFTSSEWKAFIAGVKAGEFDGGEG